MGRQATDGTGGGMMRWRTARNALGWLGAGLALWFSVAVVVWQLLAVELDELDLSGE